MDEINKYTPSEIICNQALMVSGIDVDDLKSRMNIAVYPLDSWYFDDELCHKTLMEHFHVMSIEGLGLGAYETSILAFNVIKFVVLNIIYCIPIKGELKVIPKIKVYILH